MTAVYRWRWVCKGDGLCAHADPRERDFGPCEMRTATSTPPTQNACLYDPKRLVRWTTKKERV